MKHFWIQLSLVAGLWFLLPATLWADRHALLVGVSDYTLPRIPDLQGPRNDVESLQQVLEERWRFAPENIQTLIDSDATEKAILAEFAALVTRSQPGDDIVIYFSGHGTSARDPDLGAKLNLPDNSGALVVSDFDPARLTRHSSVEAVDDGLIVGRHELKPLLEILDQDRNVLLIIDACFSGNAARASRTPFKPLTVRWFPLTPGDTQLTGWRGHSTTRSVCNDCDQTAVAPYLYRNLVYYGAAAENQLAIDISQADIDSGRVSTYDGKPHGGFTNALLTVLGGGFSDQGAPSYASIFTQLLNQFSVFCKACGHRPVSLPGIAQNAGHILDRPFLSSRLLSSRGKQQAAMQHQLIIDSSGAGQLTSEIDSGYANLESVASESPDVLFINDGDGLLATNASGELIKRFVQHPTPKQLNQWLSARRWLKQRQASDHRNGKVPLQVEFRHPLLGNAVFAGEHLSFYVRSPTSASIAILVLNSEGDLSVLYPATAQEAASVTKPTEVLRVPSDPSLLLRVTPPWGEDVVLFYALPPLHPIIDTLTDLSRETAINPTDKRLTAFEMLLDDGDLAYGAAVVPIVSSQ